MEVDCECLLCGRTDLNMYEINNNSVLIGAELIDFQDIIYDIFYAKVSFTIVFDAISLLFIYFFRQTAL